MLLLSGIVWMCEVGMWKVFMWMSSRARERCAIATALRFLWVLLVLDSGLCGKMLDE